jgi:hypothetical protein
MNRHIILAIMALACFGRLSGQDFNTAEPAPYQPANLTATTNTTDKVTLHLYGMLGYGFPLGGSYIPYNPAETDVRTLIRHTQSQTVDAQFRLTKTVDKYLNYGQGLKCQLGAEVGFLKNLAGDFSFVYTGGLPFLRVEFESQAPNGITWTETYKKHCFGITAAIKPKFMFLDLVEVYTGVGIGLYFTRLTFTNSDPYIGAYDGFIKTRPALGFIGQLGSYYPLNDRLDFKGEIAFEALSFKTSQYHSTDQNLTLQYVQNSTAANEYPPVKVPGSNWALKVGIRWKIL